jgi:hypothetical protein
MKAGMTNVATFSDHEKAERAAQCLKDAGIAAEIQDETKLQKFWFVSKPLAHQKVYVPEGSLDHAVRALNGADMQKEVLQGEVRCPKCGSPRIEYPQFTRKFMTTTLLEVLCLVGILKREFYCTDCHFEWPAKVTLRSSTDILRWPERKKERHLVRNENLT